MQLDAALTEIAAFLGLDADALIAYAAEDDIGGFDFDASKATFPGGSIWSVEGQVLYALVRALKATTVYEFGTLHGASATHMLSAIEQNGAGVLHSVDVWEGAGTLVPERLRHNWTMTYAAALNVIPTIPDDSIDIAYLDMLHGDKEAFDCLTALHPKMKANAIVIHHDSEHGDDGVKVKAGVVEAGVRDYISNVASPSDCGLLIHRWGQ